MTIKGYNPKTDAFSVFERADFMNATCSVRCFDVTLKGYNPNTDATDHLVKWVTAPSMEVLNQWLDEMGLREMLADEPRDMGDYAANYDFSHGVDIALTVEHGKIIAKSQSGKSISGNLVVDWCVESYIVTAEIQHPHDYCFDHGGSYNPETCIERCPECKRNRWSMD